jgi:hypothetical protein
MVWFSTTAPPIISPAAFDWLTGVHMGHPSIFPTVALRFDMEKHEGDNPQDGSLTNRSTGKSRQKHCPVATRVRIGSQTKKGGVIKWNS